MKEVSNAFFHLMPGENSNCLSIKAQTAIDMHIHNEGVTVDHKTNAHAHSYTMDELQCGVTHILICRNLLWIIPVVVLCA